MHCVGWKSIVLNRLVWSHNGKRTLCVNSLLQSSGSMKQCLPSSPHVDLSWQECWWPFWKRTDVDSVTRSTVVLEAVLPRWQRLEIFRLKRHHMWFTSQQKINHQSGGKPASKSVVAHVLHHGESDTGAECWWFLPAMARGGDVHLHGCGAHWHGDGNGLHSHWDGDFATCEVHA